MKQLFIIKEDHSQLLLFFAGWGMDATPFSQIHPGGNKMNTTPHAQTHSASCDWMICYDYRFLEFDPSMLQGYSDITLVAWSMGVWVASQIMKLYPTLPVSQSIAINGTLTPIDDLKGISQTVFEGTLQGLNELTLQKFQRRMCGSSAEYKAFQTVAPQRPVEELKEELAAIQQHFLASSPSAFRWQKAVIGKGDRIFLPENQRRAWENNADLIEEIKAAHYQNELLTSILTSKL